MADNSLIIIGAGIAGLAAGCYGQMNGYQTAIYEMHTKPGGLCTAWQRQGYTFDGCIHWLMGTSPQLTFYKVWDELGAFQGHRPITHEEFVRIAGPDGQALVIYTQIDRLERHLKELSPADAPVIDEFIEGMRLFSTFDGPPTTPRELMTAEEGARMMARLGPYLPAMDKWLKVSAGEFAARFQDPFLRRAFPLVFGPQAPMFLYFLFLAGMDHGDGGYPVGGSLEFARAIERRYLQLGGEIHYDCRVTKILVEAGTGPDGQAQACAAGILLADGTERRADTIVSAADGRTTLFEMLDGKYLSDEFRGYYRDLPVYTPVVQISLGIRRDLSAEPHAVTYLLEPPVTIAGEARETLPIRHYCYDPSLAPAGGSVVEVFLGSSHDYWKGVAEDRERYEAEKQQAATAVIGQLERLYPGITADIEVVDVATPLTTERYTGNWQGSIQGWNPIGKNMAELMMRGMSKTLTGLEEFYMIGQWVEPGGGLPAVGPSGRKLIQILCHRDGKPFVAGVPVSV